MSRPRRPPPDGSACAAILGRCAEEQDQAQGRWIGHTPQAFTYLTMGAAALALAGPDELPAELRLPRPVSAPPGP